MIQPHPRTATSAGGTPAAERFHFHPRATDPELWRTTVPLIVRVRCGRHKGLIATWTAIHWLIVLHAASGRAHFGVREIAEEASVGRNELTGEKGHIQQLVRLGLIRIVGYKHFSGLREPRPVYHIDLVELERLSLELVPEVLRDHHVDRPPPAAPDPRQLQLFDLAPLPPHPIAPVAPDVGPAARAAGHPAAPLGRETGPVAGSASHESGTATAPGAQSPPDTRRYLHRSRTARDGGAPAGRRPTPESRTGAHGSGTAMALDVQAPPGAERGTHPFGTAHARNRDVDRENDRMIEGGRQTLTPNLLTLLVTQATEAVLATLQARGDAPVISTAPPALTATPPAPAGAEPLPAPVLALWQGDKPAVSRRELHQLAMIAAEVDALTGGHGAYWLGRAILMADLCLGDRGQARSLPYLRRMLRRWREEDSWGSDRVAAEPPRPATEAPARPRPAPEPAAPHAPSHPAVAAYIAALHEAPNAVQAAQIAQTVTDLEVWRQVLREWQLNGWAERSVGKMLDRYQKTTPAAAEGPPPSVAAVHTYPGLAPEQRDRWIKRFHAAATPAEKRAVLSRLEQEHPR